VSELKEKAATCDSGVKCSKPARKRKSDVPSQANSPKLVNQEQPRDRQEQQQQSNVQTESLRSEVE
jgi:hypothetical protein